MPSQGTFFASGLLPASDTRQKAASASDDIDVTRLGLGVGAGVGLGLGVSQTLTTRPPQKKQLINGVMFFILAALNCNFSNFFFLGGGLYFLHVSFTCSVGKKKMCIGYG